MNWRIMLPASFAADCLVLLMILTILRCGNKRTVFKRLFWKFWLLTLASYYIEILWLLLGTCLGTQLHIANPSHSPFGNPVVFLWISSGAAGAGVFTYFFAKDIMTLDEALSEQLTRRKKHLIALTMAIVTAPWLFFIPVY